MADPTPIDNLNTLRTALVERRREIALDAASDNREWAAIPNARNMGAKGSDRGLALKSVQEAIEAVDRAIADEACSLLESAPEERESYFDQRTRGRTDIA